MVRISPDAAGNATPRALHPRRTDVAIVVSGGRLIAARSPLLGVLHREHFTSSHGNTPVIAWPIVGEGCAGPPSLHILSFQLWHARLSASRISAPLFLRTLGQYAGHRARLHKLLAQSLPCHRRITAWDGTWEPWLMWRVGCGTGRRRCWSGFQDARPLNYAREIRDRLFVEGGRPSLSRLPDFRQVAAGQDRQEARCHPPIKAVPAAAGKSSYRLGPDGVWPLPIAGVDKRRRSGDGRATFSLARSSRRISLLPAGLYPMRDAVLHADGA
jgi:hypothetical protein